MEIIDLDTRVESNNEDFRIQSFPFTYISSFYECTFRYFYTKLIINETLENIRV